MTNSLYIVGTYESRCNQILDYSLDFISNDGVENRGTKYDFPRTPIMIKYYDTVFHILLFDNSSNYLEYNIQIVNYLEKYYIFTVETIEIYKGNYIVQNKLKIFSTVICNSTKKTHQKEMNNTYKTTKKKYNQPDKIST